MKNRFLATLFVLSLTAASLMGCGSKKEEAVAEEPSTEENVIQAAEIEREFEFYSDDEEIIYFNFDEEVEEDGKKYGLTQDIELETLGTRDVIQQVVDLDVEKLEDVEETLDYEGANGKKYTLKNEQIYVREKGLVKIPIYETVTYEDQVGKPSIPGTRTIVWYNEATGEDESFEGILQDSYESTPGHWEAALCVDGLFNAPSDASNEYQLAGTNNVSVSRYAATPEWEGYQNDILKSLHLSSKYYRINSAEWNGDQYYQDGRVYRAARFLGDKYVSTYKAEYEGEREVEGYMTKVFYRTDVDGLEEFDQEDVSTVFKIKAVVTYRLVEE